MYIHPVTLHSNDEHHSHTFLVRDFRRPSQLRLNGQEWMI